jgi:hypothetical protein
MSDRTDLLIERSREVRAQADFLKAWSEAVHETSRHILEDQLNRAPGWNASLLEALVREAPPAPTIG